MVVPGTPNGRSQFKWAVTALSRPEPSEQGQEDSDERRKTTIQQDCWQGGEKQRSREKQQLKTPYYFIRQARFVAEHPLHIHKIKEEYYRW